MKTLNKEIEEQKKLLLDKFNIKTDRDATKLLSKNSTNTNLTPKGKEIFFAWIELQNLYVRREAIKETINGNYGKLDPNGNKLKNGMSPKEKVIMLYKTFLENKEHPLSDDYDRRRYSQSFNVGYIYSYKHTYTDIEHTYLKKGGTIYSGGTLYKGDITYYNKYTDYNFLPLKELRGGGRKVILYLTDEPRLELTEEINAIIIDSKTINSISWKGWRKYLKERISIIHTKYEVKTTRILSFGNVTFNLDEKEFNELYTFAENLQKTRGGEIDEAKLDIRLEEYTTKS